MENTMTTNSAQTPNIINTFEEISYRKSAEIYRLFSQGKVLNKQQYNDIHGCFIDDELFTLVFNKVNHFTLFFKHMGYELKFDEEGEFYFTQEIRDNNNEESDDNAIKIQAVLLFVGRYYAKVGDLAQLSDPMFGIKETDIEALKQDELLLSSLKALRLKDWDTALDFLANRNLIFKMAKDRYVFSSAAMAFLNRLIDAHTAFVNK